MTTTETKQDPSSAGDRYRVLLDVSRRLSATLSQDELYSAIYEETDQALDASGFYLALHDQSRDLARIVYFADRGQGQRVDYSYRGSDSEVFRTQQASLIHDDLQEGSLLVLGDDDSALARSAITVPIKRAGRMLGAVSAQSYEPNAYSEADLEMLQGIADVAAVALQNSIQFAELERRRREAEKLEEIGRALTSELDPEQVLDKVIAAVLDVLDVDGTAVWLCDLHRDPICRVAESGGEIALPVGLEWNIDGALRDALDDRREPVLVDNLHQTDLVPQHVADHMSGGSAIGVPVVVRGQVEGILTAGSRMPRHFSPEDTGVLQRLANQLAVALGNARLHADVHALSLTDPLTMLPNRRRLQIHLEHEIAAARRGRRVGIALLDINRFKHYNDTFGHVAGDEILRAVGSVLAEENRAMNLVARFGGDEFVAVLSGADMEGVQNYADRVMARVRANGTLEKFGISVSIGMAVYDPDEMASANDVLRAADTDMYETKERQRLERATEVDERGEDQ